MDILVIPVPPYWLPPQGDAWFPMPVAAEWLLGVFLFWIGSAVGSFMNVVIYRVPAGKSIVYPGSHCPKCSHAIRPYDNIPVVSWFLLRGRCRDCGTRISAGYPLVEALVGSVFVTLAIVEVFSGGANLPVRAGAGLVAAAPAGEVLWCVYAYHLLLICTLLCIAFVEYDGKRLPLSLAAPAIAVGLAAPLFLPELRPVPLWSSVVVWLGAGSTMAGLLEGVAGLAAGAGMAVLVRPAAGLGASREGTKRYALCTLTLIGLFLGWQAVLLLGAVTLTAGLLVAAVGRYAAALRRVQWSACLLLGSFFWILAWKPLWTWMTTRMPWDR